MLLCVPGDYWPWFVVMALVAVPPAVFVGPNWQRILGVTFMVASLGLVAMDIYEGKKKDERRKRLRTQGQNEQSFQWRTNRPSEPSSR